MGLFSNPGSVNVDALRESAEVNGYKEYTRDDGDSIHHTISNGVKDSGCRYVSWDENKETGEVSGMHSTKNGGPYMDYGN